MFSKLKIKLFFGAIPFIYILMYPHAQINGKKSIKCFVLETKTKLFERFFWKQNYNKQLLPFLNHKFIKLEN